MVGNAGDPLSVRRGRGEVVLDVVVVNGRTRVALFRVDPCGQCRREPLLRAQPPRPTRLDAGALEVVGQEPVAEGRIVAVGVDQRIGQGRIFEIPVADRVRWFGSCPFGVGDSPSLVLAGRPIADGVLREGDEEGHDPEPVDGLSPGID